MAQKIVKVIRLIQQYQSVNRTQHDLEKKYYNNFEGGIKNLFFQCHRAYIVGCRGASQQGGSLLGIPPRV